MRWKLARVLPAYHGRRARPTHGDNASSHAHRRRQHWALPTRRKGGGHAAGGVGGGGGGEGSSPPAKISLRMMRPSLPDVITMRWSTGCSSIKLTWEN